jgi:hypothetical protein
MTPIVTTPHPNTDRRWASSGDATVRPNALIVDGLKLPSAVSTAAKIHSQPFEGRLDRLAEPPPNLVFRSPYPDQSHFPHRGRHHQT